MHAKPTVQKAGWVPGPVWTDAEYLVQTGIRSPDRPARSESLYRLSYPGPFYTTCTKSSHDFWRKDICCLLQEVQTSSGAQPASCSVDKGKGKGAPVTGHEGREGE